MIEGEIIKKYWQMLFLSKESKNFKREKTIKNQIEDI